MADIYRINSNLPVNNKIEILNEFILALAGKITASEFNLNEIVQMCTDLSLSRQYLRNQLLGNAIDTFSKFTHIHAESGYSIWKYTPTNYKYNAVNRVYMDDKTLTNEGEALSETALTFSKVYLFDGVDYIDDTTEAGSETGTEFNLMNGTDNYLYVGNSTKFSGCKFEFQTRGSNYTLLSEYYNGSSWVSLDSSGITYVDNTLNLESDGNITFTEPTDWATTTVNGSSQYWVRFSSSTIPVSVAKAYYLIPATSVIGLLAMSTSEVISELWKFCSYNGSIYLTIRNTGNSAYERDYYISSSSSTANKQAFFIDNHVYKADYENSTYVPV